MPTSKVNFYFKLSGISGEFTIDTQQNVKKHIPDVLYLESPPDDSVNLYYVGAKELNALDNIFIADRSTSLYENNKSKETEFIGTYAGAINLRNTNFVVTQEFLEIDSGNIPLYYKYSLPTTTYIDSIKLFDKDFNEVSLFKVVKVEDRDEDTGIPTGGYLSYDVYNDYPGYFDYSTGDYEAYFIQYSYNDGGTKQTVTTLLDNELAYTKATWEDFWAETFSLKPWGRAYNINDNLMLQLPTNTAFAVRYVGERRLSVHYPTSVDNISPWYVGISNSSFKTSYYSSGYKYSVAEFSNQAFNPIEPYKLAINQKAYKVTDRLVALPSGNIQDSIVYSKVNLLFEKGGNVEYALTNDASKNNAAYTDIAGKRSVNSETNSTVYWDSDNFLSMDKLSGLIYVGIDVDDSYDIKASFSYEEEFYSLTSLNLNPVFNSDASESIYSIYIVPESTENGNLGTQDASIMWLKISKNGVILDTSQDGTNNNEDLKKEAELLDVSGYTGYGITGVIGLHYGWRAYTKLTSLLDFLSDTEVSVQSTSSFPEYGWLRAKDFSGKYIYFRYISKTDTTFNLDPAVVPNAGLSILDGESIELVNFVDERTTETIRDGQEELDAFGLSVQNPSIFSRYFTLAELSVNQPHGVSDLAIIDVRQNGGGIKEDKYDEAKEINPEVQWYSDFNNFAGQVLPGNAALVVKLPIALLDDYSLADLKALVNDRMPMGVHPIIRFYGYQPRIASITSVSAGIIVKWEKEGSDFTYDIWYSTGEDGPWVKANSTPLTDGAGTVNSYTISSLTSNAIYSVKVTMTDNYS